MGTLRQRYNLTHNMAGLIMAIIGTAWWLVPMIMMQLDGHHHHGHHMDTSDCHCDHGPTILGMNEMTWMWYVMAITHFFINDTICPEKCCSKEEND